MPFAFLCDFDGTVSPVDIGAAFARAFSRNGAAEQEALLVPWIHGTVGHRELTVAQCGLISAGPEEALAFTRGFRLDPGFAPFVAETLAHGGQVMVVSEGFDFYVADQLARAGLADLEFASNRLRFENGRVVPEFPWEAGGCGRCGNCKAPHVRRWRDRGYATVLVGDGLSDRCGAREADRVLARGELLAWCRREGLPAGSFADFAEVAAIARRWREGGAG
ncbi:MAG TPA: haloacid dehalogenase-like hydrolase [Terriglobales bacterium]|nr:haloacid dehalogenase-like hydrolase [Terriglobales bacterium]